MQVNKSANSGSVCCNICVLGWVDDESIPYHPFFNLTVLFYFSLDESNSGHKKLYLKVSPLEVNYVAVATEAFTNEPVI
jgi:hypothetical protein